MLRATQVPGYQSEYVLINRTTGKEEVIGYSPVVRCLQGEVTCFSYELDPTTLPKKDDDDD